LFCCSNHAGHGIAFSSLTGIAGGFINYNKRREGLSFTYKFADAIKSVFIFRDVRDVRRNFTTLYEYSFGVLSSKAGMIFSSLLSIMPKSAKSKIADQAPTPVMRQPSKLWYINA
jgi:hypothetical protein